MQIFLSLTTVFIHLTSKKKQQQQQKKKKKKKKKNRKKQKHTNEIKELRALVGRLSLSEAGENERRLKIYFFHLTDNFL